MGGSKPRRRTSRDLPPAAPKPAVRRLTARDLPEVVRIDAAQTGARKPAYWRRVLLDRRPPEGGARVRLAAPSRSGLAGYLIGEVRAFEFGSEPCGWVVAIAVDRGHVRTCVASALLDSASVAFRRAGVTSVRTMVRRNDVPVLSFFRSNRFVAGAYVQLELDLTELADTEDRHGR